MKHREAGHGCLLNGDVEELVRKKFGGPVHMKTGPPLCSSTRH